MLSAVSSFLESRRPAVFECAVTFPTVRMAGHDLGADHLVRAARNKAWPHTAAMLYTETLACRGGGAAHHGARLVLASAVSVAMRFFSRYQPSGAA